MLPKSLAALLLGLSPLALAAAPPAPPPEIALRHALTGEAAAALVELVGRFNAESKAGKVALQHVGMVADPHQLPHLALLDDDEQQRFFNGHPRMLPLYKVMDGKTVIHPTQIAVANEVFGPGAEEVAAAEKIVAVFERPENAGKGAISLDGRMVELLHRDMARRTLALRDAIARMGGE